MARVKQVRLDLHDPADPFKWIRETSSRIAGNPYPEGTAAYKAYDLGWNMGREQLMRDVTTADPRKLAATFTKHFILMRPDTFRKRLAAERKHSSHVV